MSGVFVYICGMRILNLQGIGALPVGFKGKINGKAFSIRVQYDAFGGVKAQLFSDDDGSIITTVQGNKGEIEPKGSSFGQWALIGTELNSKVGKYYDKDKDQIRKKAKEFIKNLHSEVVDFNKGKDTRIKKVQTVVIAPKPTVKKAPVKATAKKETVKAPAKKETKYSTKLDKMRSAEAPGKRAAGPNAKKPYYYEYRRNRTDKPGTKL